MAGHMKKSIGGSIHRIREFELEKVNLAEEFDILQIVGEGWFGKILLVEHRASDTEMVLKALPKAYTSLRDFYREFHYGLHLGAHKNIITAYDVSFETAGFYVFSQEYAPLGDLTSNVTENGIGELHSKRVARQLAAALDHLHARELVHRDVKLDNILVFKSDFSRVKLCDFGETRRTGSLVRRRNEWLPYAPPEVLQTNTDDNYKAVTSHDVWQYGIVIFVCLTGCLPWQKAAADDPRYLRYTTWHSSAMSPIRKQPKLFKLISSKAQRLFRKFLEPRPDKRPATVTDLHRYLDDRWLAKSGPEKNHVSTAEDDGLCPSMYSFHSSPEEKNKLLYTLTQYGIETTVDRSAKKDRIRAWIQNSVIEEEEESAEATPSDETVDVEEEEEEISMLDNETGPIGERVKNRGPVDARRMSSPKDANTIPGNPTQMAKSQNITSHRSMKRTDEQPIIPPRKHEKRHRDNASKRKVVHDKVYSPPIDPTVPLEYQRNIKAMNDTANATIKNDVPQVSRLASTIPNYRNPNAFLDDSAKSRETEQTNNIPNLDTPHITTQYPQQSDFNIQSYVSAPNTYPVPNNFNANVSAPPANNIQPQNNINPISFNSQQPYIDSYTNMKIQLPQPNINYSNPYNLNMQTMEQMNNDSYIKNNSVSEQRHEIIEKQPISTIAPNLGISNALANSGMLAITGVVQLDKNINNNDTTKLNETRNIVSPLQPSLSEKEKDRNYSVYGIDTKKIEMRKTTVSSQTKNKLIKQLSPSVTRKQKNDERRVTFNNPHSSTSRSTSTSK